MEIKIDIVTILKSIEHEYGIDELIKRIKLILGIDLFVDKTKKVTTKYTTNSIIIEEDGLTHTIAIDEESYYYKKQFTTYYTIKYYDLNKSIFRKSTSFNLNEDEILVLDEFDDERFSTRRIVKTTKDDKDFARGTFEKERLVFYNPSIIEEYSYKESNKEVATHTKTILLPENLYVENSHRIINAASTNYINGQIDSASSKSTPDLKFIGRTREENELLNQTFQVPYPNILIRGRLNNEELTFYYLKITKIDNSIRFFLVENNLSTNKINEYEHSLASDTLDTLTSQDIDTIIKYLEKLIVPYKNEIKEELLTIKQQYLIYENNLLKCPDFLDFKFEEFNRFEDLAFDIYLNLPEYERKINNILNPTKEDTPPTLRKI